MILPVSITGFYPNFITVPQGGRLDFTVRLTNKTGLKQRFFVWLDVYLSKDEPYAGNPIVQPTNAHLAPHQTLDIHKRFAIPSWTPPSTYLFCFVIGPDTTSYWDRKYFEVTVKPKKGHIFARKLIDRLQRKSRDGKFRYFFAKIHPSGSDTILDIGAGSGWFLEERYPWKENIIALDISMRELNLLRSKFSNIKLILADACALPFKEKSVDIVLANAVIEHVGDKKKQQIFAREIERVGKKYFVTTPNKYFPFELHYRLPFYQFSPKRLRKWVHKHLNIPRGQQEIEEINLLTAQQLKTLFPLSVVKKHRITFYPETLSCFKMN